MSCVLLDLDEHGALVDTDRGEPVLAVATAGFLASRLRIPPEATDIVVFVHGWRTRPAKAARNGVRLAELVATTYRQRPQEYPAIAGWSPYYVIVRWPSLSSPFGGGYRRVRERAHDRFRRGVLYGENVECGLRLLICVADTLRNSYGCQL